MLAEVLLAVMLAGFGMFAVLVLEDIGQLPDIEPHELPSFEEVPVSGR